MPLWMTWPHPPQSLEEIPRLFWGWRWFSAWRDFPWRELSVAREVSADELFRRNFTVFYNVSNFLTFVLLRLCRLNVTCGDIPGEIFRGVGINWKIFPGREKLSKGEILHGGFFRWDNFPPGVPHPPWKIPPISENHFLRRVGFWHYLKTIKN